MALGKMGEGGGTILTTLSKTGTGGEETLVTLGKVGAGGGAILVTLSITGAESGDNTHRILCVMSVDGMRGEAQSGMVAVHGSDCCGCDGINENAHQR